MDKLTNAINAYEKESHMRIVIRKSTKTSRLYKCGSHDGCSFNARFRPRYSDKMITLKNHCIIHTWDAKAAIKKGERKWTTRQTGLLDPSLDYVTQRKDSNPVSEDIQKTAANVKGLESSFNQCYSTLEEAKDDKFRNGSMSFQLEKLKELYPDAHLDWKRDENDNLSYVFVCVGCANNVLMQVRPCTSPTTRLATTWLGRVGSLVL